jgi:hypothetical protein
MLFSHKTGYLCDSGAQFWIMCNLSLSVRLKLVKIDDPQNPERNIKLFIKLLY